MDQGGINSYWRFQFKVSLVRNGSRMEDGSRRNSSSEMMNAAQVSILATRMTLQEAPLMGTCLMNIQEGGKPKNI